ncbi:MAG TPA: type IV secretion system DNA-binding domain-containing protein [Solirubrobacteraceae bacterium]|nr:type IV secretion system DNA-binding domain-containing protein [Solirubrobacteraceae bacterium]
MIGAAGEPSGSADGPPRRAYWLLPVAVALLVIPAAPATLVLAGVLACSAALSLVRAAAARRARATAAAPRADAIVLGSDAGGRAVRLCDRQLSAHGLIVGASGAGKSTTLLRILTEQIARGRPVIAIDLKGSPGFADELAHAAAAAGRPFRVWTPDGPEHWNPLAHGNATELKDKLISSERFTEPHYQRAAERYVQTVLQVLHESRPGQAPTLDEVVELMEPRRLAAALRDLPAARATRVQDYLAAMTPDQLSAVRGLGTRLAIITESHTGPFLTPGPARTIDLRAALDGREVVLFSLNSSVYGRLSAQLGALAIQDLVAATGDRLARLGRGAAPVPQAIVGIDEFSALGADNVLALLARGRESGVSVLLATQELADLDRAGHGFRDQVLGVTAVKVIHRQDVPASAQLVAQMAGTHTVWEHTYQIGRGPLGTHATSRGTRRQVERFVIHPNQAKTLPTGKAIVITKTPAARVDVVTVRHRERGVEL